MINRTTVFSVMLAIIGTGALLNFGRQVPGFRELAEYVTEGYGT